MSITERDAVVIGGGPAGATAALLLARAGWSITLLERKTFPRPKVCGEYLSATNLPLFDRLGIGEQFRSLAGPPVTRVGLFAGQTMAHAALPRAGRHGDWGRALAREHLDSWLLDQTRAAGAEVLQPWNVEELRDAGPMTLVTARCQSTGASANFSTPIVIAAHGSWDPGRLPTQTPRGTARASDLLAFKAHFRGSDLPAGLMPLLAFPGGYGGMVHGDGGKVSLSCCIRRDVLALVRRRHPGPAGSAVLAHIQASCLGVRQALQSAVVDGGWLAAGPIRPGMRVDGCCAGRFLVGNAAGEAHPVVAEGISMALQSSWLLADKLIAWKRAGGSTNLAAVARQYAAAWRAHFAPRIWASTAIAHWAMRQTPVSLSLPLVRTFPTLLTWGARLAGKADAILLPHAVKIDEFLDRRS